MSAWISVKERLPDERSEVLCFNGYSITVAWYASSVERWYADRGDYRLEDVTHWQPLPEPPEDR